MISDRIYDDIPPQMKILNMVIPILMYFLTFTNRKHFILFCFLLFFLLLFNIPVNNFSVMLRLYFVQNVSFVSDVNHYVDQSLATLLLTSGF